MAASSSSSELPALKERLIQEGLKEDKILVITELPITRLKYGPKIVSLTPAEEAKILSDEIPTSLKAKIAEAPYIVGYTVQNRHPKAGTGTISEILYLLISDGQIETVEVQSSYACAGRGEIISAKLASTSSHDPALTKAALNLIYAGLSEFKPDNNYIPLHSLLFMKYDPSADLKINVRVCKKLWS